MHPFIVLVAVLFGSTLLGVLGALVAIPIAASVQIAHPRVVGLPPRPAVAAITVAAGPDPAVTPTAGDASVTPDGAGR